MTHDERIRMVAEWLKVYLGRFKMPESLDADAVKSEMVEIAQSINSRLPSSLNTEATRERLNSVGHEVNLKHKTRAWPMLVEFMEAMDRAQKATTLAGSGSEVEEFMLERCEDWHSKFQEPMPSCVTEDRAIRLLERGRCGTAREMHRAGYSLPERLRDREEARQ